MSNGRGAPRAPNRSPDPPGCWRCVKCSNFVRRGTSRCGCGHTPPARVSAVPEPTRRTEDGTIAVLLRMLQQCGGDISRLTDTGASPARAPRQTRAPAWGAAPALPKTGRDEHEDDAGENEAEE